MPHQCVKCGEFYSNTSPAILKGCEKCGSRFFFYVRKEKMAKARKLNENLSSEDKVKIEKDVKDIIGEYLDYDAPVILDLAVIDVSKPGKFQLDLVKLFNKAPMVYEMEEGKYIIDVAGTCSSFLNKDEK